MAEMADYGLAALGIGLGQYNASKDRQFQREFARYGVRWRVQDAKAAGIHPLAALGMPQTQATPVHVGQDPSAALEGASQGGMRDAMLQEAVQSANAKKSEAHMLENQGDYYRSLRRNEDLKYNAEIADAVKRQDDYDRKGIRRYGKLKSKTNPEHVFDYYEDPYSGKILAIPKPDAAEGGEGAIGSKLFYYGNVREHGADFIK